MWKTISHNNGQKPHQYNGGEASQLFRVAGLSSQQAIPIDTHANSLAEEFMAQQSIELTQVKGKKVKTNAFTIKKRVYITQIFLNRPPNNGKKHLLKVTQYRAEASSKVSSKRS